MFRGGARIASPINLPWPQLRLAAVLRERGEQQALAEGGPGLLAKKIRPRARRFRNPTHVLIITWKPGGGQARVTTSGWCS